jgi:glutamyl-tRNA synthetase
MIQRFDIDGVNRAASTFDIQKLRWLNQYYIKSVDESRLQLLLGQRLSARGIDTRDGPDLASLVTILRERSQTLEEMAQKSDYFYRDFENYEEIAARKHLRPVTAKVLVDLRLRLAALTEWRVETIHDVLTETAEANDAKLGKIAQPLRVAVSGTAATPPIDETVALVGRKKTLERIGRALRFVEERTSDDT